MTNFKDVFALTYIVRQTWFKAVCVAFLIVFIVVFSLELTDRVLFRPKGIFARSVRDFEKQKRAIQVLFLGQSDIQYDIIPDEFGYRAYNFAGGGESFLETYYKLKYYIRDMPELKIVVVPLALPSFSSFRANAIQWEYFLYGYIKYSDLIELYKLKGPMVIREKLLSFCPIIDRMTMINFLRNMKNLLTGQPINKTEIYNGYIKTVGSNITEDVALKRLQRQFEGYNIFDNNFLLYFEKILKLCKENDIKVFVVTLPVSGSYLEHSKKYISKNLLYEKVINNPVYNGYIDKYLNLLEIYINHDELFLNQDHLNYDGALKVSRLIAAEWSKPIKEIIDVQ